MQVGFMPSIKLLLWSLLSLYATTAVGQAAVDSAAAEAPSDSDMQTILDQSPFVSARAAGMGGALSTLADGLDSAYYNPAGIGGIHTGKTNPRTLRGLYFPYLGLAANKNASNLKSDFNSQGGGADPAVGQSIIDANAGRRQYARASYLLGFTVGRTLTTTFSDVQLAAIKSTGSTSDEGDISMKYRSISGTGSGFSATDSQGRIYLGMFSSINKMTLISADHVNYLDVINTDRRKQILKENSTKWTGISTTAGLLWNFSKIWHPTFGIVARDVGKTTYKAAGTLEDGAPTTMLVDQDLTTGFSISPEMGKQGVLNFIIEGHHLSAKEMSLNKKFRAALEANFGGFGSNSTFGLRTGYNSAGASYGTNINLGLMQFELASEAIDVGINNMSITERRNVAIFSVNLANE